MWALHWGVPAAAATHFPKLVAGSPDGVCGHVARVVSAVGGAARPGSGGSVYLMDGRDVDALRPIRVCWIANDDDEASYVGAARLPGVPPLDVEWHRIPPPLETLAGYDLIVADPGALRLPPDECEQRLHADLPSLPLVFVSGLAQHHHLRAAGGLRFDVPSLVHWIAHGEHSLTAGLPRRLAEIARET